MATASEVRLSCGCADEKHLGTSCSCMVCAEDPSSDHPTTACPLSPEERPEAVRQAAYETRKQKVEERMKTAVKMASRLLYPEDGAMAGTGVLAIKFYDELKAAEAEAKAEADAIQVPTPAKAAVGDVATVAITPVFTRDMRKEGWKFFEHTPRRINSVVDLELVPFLKSGEDSIRGEEMVRRARNELDANYGYEDAEWLLEHQDEIPTEFQKFYLTFPGTVWQDSHGHRNVPYLGWTGKRWYPGFYLLEDNWRSGVRLLRFSKSR